MKYHMIDTEYHIHTQEHTLSSVPTSTLITENQRLGQGTMGDGTQPAEPYTQ